MPEHLTTSPDEQDLIALLRARGRRATSQRLVVLRELRRRNVHVSADELLAAVRRRLPGTSTPTIYATLDLLVQLGLVRRLDVGTGAALYDARLAPHHHTVCRSCGRVDDVDGSWAADEVLGAAAGAGFRPEGVEVVVHGTCASCAAPVPDRGG